MAVHQVVESTDATPVETNGWNPAQIIALVAGVGFIVLGAVALIRTGFDTNHIYTPQDLVWRMPHSPLLGIIEVGYGALLVLSGVVPYAWRSLMTLLGAAAVAFGLIVLSEDMPNRLNHWLGVTHRSGWLYLVVGAVLVVAAIVARLVEGEHHTVVRETHIVS